jgi:hypothetical protein
MHQLPFVIFDEELLSIDGEAKIGARAFSSEVDAGSREENA